MPRPVPHSIPNLFDADLLDRLAGEEEPPATEAETAGPWRVEPAAEGGWACLAEGEETPLAVLAERHGAYLLAAALPASGEVGRFRIGEAAGPPYPLLEDGRPAGTLAVASEELVSTLNLLAAVGRSPRSVAFLLRALGRPVLERAGRIVASWIAEEGVAR